MSRLTVPHASTGYQLKPTSLLVRRVTLTLVVRRGGSVIPWIGPALRGILARRLKNNVCRQAPDERDARWRYCTGCPHIAACEYACLFETGGELIDSPQAKGRNGVLRPFVLAPLCPHPTRLRRGDELSVCVTTIGTLAAKARKAALAALGQAGRHPGLGPDRIQFDVESLTPEETHTLRPTDLPRSPASNPGVMPRLEVQLRTPLFLGQRDTSGKRQMLTVPSFGDLCRAAMRTISSLVTQQGESLQVDFQQLAASADSVCTERSKWRVFEQWRSSHRTKQQYELRGVTGSAVFRDVPLALLPWMAWGGRLHVGQHRVAGAGYWSITLE